MQKSAMPFRVHQQASRAAYAHNVWRNVRLRNSGKRHCNQREYHHLFFHFNPLSTKPCGLISNWLALNSVYKNWLDRLEEIGPK